MRYFFIEQSEIAGGQAIITGSDAKHVKTVLRLKPGDEIGLFDGQGLEYAARIISGSSGQILVSIEKSFPSNTESPVRIAVAQALLQDKKMDVLVRQLTELGIAKWMPFIAHRSVPRPDEKRMRVRKERWERIAQETIKQCRRGRIPEIHAAVSFEDLLSSVSVDDLKIAFWEEETKPFDPDNIPENIIDLSARVRNILIMVGPEGGLTSDEVDRARTYGFFTVSLGPRILRAETAAIAGCTLVQYLFGDMGHFYRGGKKS